MHQANSGDSKASNIHTTNILSFKIQDELNNETNSSLNKWAPHFTTEHKKGTYVLWLKSYKQAKHLNDAKMKSKHRSDNDEENYRQKWIK